MGDLFDVHGNVLNNKEIEVDGFIFDSAALQNNPFLMLMGLICIDPTEKQAELLRKADVTFTDAKGKQIFPPVVEDEEEKG